MKRLEDAGCAAVVLHSLFEEPLTATHDGRIRHMDQPDPTFAGTLADFPDRDDYPPGPDAHAGHLHRLKQAVKIYDAPSWSAHSVPPPIVH